MAKKLFVLVADGGDGSFYPKYTFNEEWILERFCWMVLETGL